MAKQESIRSISLDHITRDPSLQMRVTINEDHVQELAAKIRDGGGLPDSSLPKVFSDGTNNWLADGNHTYEAHIAAGVRKMRCLVIPGGYRDAWTFALGANCNHGLKRTQADKRKAILAALKDEEFCKLSDSEVARLCGLPFHNLVSDVRKSLAAGVEKVEYRTGSERGWYDAEGNPVEEKPVQKAVESLADVPEEIADFQVDEKIEAALKEADAGTTGVFDAKGRPVPESLVGVWEERKRINSIRQTLGGIASELKKIKGGDGSYVVPLEAAKWIDVQSACKSIDDVQRILRFGSPYIVCPRCGGSRRWGGNSCETCHGAGFVPELAYSRLDPDLKRLSEQWTERGEAFDGVEEPKQLEVLS